MIGILTRPSIRIIMMKGYMGLTLSQRKPPRMDAGTATLVH